MALLPAAMLTEDSEPCLYMVTISFEIDGKKVNPEAMKDVLDSLFLKHLHEMINDCLGTLECPKHSQEPEVKVIGKDIDSLEFGISGCCNDLIEETRIKLSTLKK